MREMKDSGIGWVSDIPSNWEVKRSKYCFNHTKQIAGSNADDYERLALTMNGVIKRSKDDNNGLQPEKFETYQVLKTDQLVFKLIDLQNISTSRVGLSPYLGLVSPAYIVLNVDKSKVCPKFAEQYFLMLWRNQVFNALGDAGVRSSLNATELLELPIVLPPLAEQKRIADFLDGKCAEIDGLVADIQSQIDILEQYKRSVITETVTKGLNPDAEMKDSGIQWVGIMPSHWSVSKIKYEIAPLQRAVQSNDLVMTCFRDGEVTLRQRRREDGFTISFTENGYQGVEIGDLVIHGMDAFAGAIGCADSRGKITPVVHVCKTTGNNRFFMYMLRSMAFNGVLMSFAEGIRVRSSDFRNFEKLGKFTIALPAIQEQNEIVTFLDERCAEIEKIIAQKKEQIEVLSNYKSSFIYEYVTGKKKVPM